MYRTKREVDKHVSGILNKIKNENERNLRGYNFANMYFLVQDYECAKRYLAGFLSLKERDAAAHKLMGQIYEKTGHCEKALHSYKRSLELEENQKDVVLKICELYCNFPVDPERARYWADRAEILFPNDDIVFRLRQCIISADGEENSQELEDLIATELTKRPCDVRLRIKLIKLYLDTERSKEAYEHAVLVESKRPYTDSSDWYYCLTDTLEAYLEDSGRMYTSEFFVHLLNAYDRLVQLNLDETRRKKSKNINQPNQIASVADCAAALHSFDQTLYKAWHLSEAHEGWWGAFLHHMRGQLYFHLGSLILKRAKQEQMNMKEASRMSSGLFLVAYTFKAPELHSSWYAMASEVKQKEYNRLYEEACFRLSQTGHVICGLCKEDRSKWLQKIRQQVCTVQGREKVFQRAFNSRDFNQTSTTSQLMSDDAFTAFASEFPDAKALQDYDDVAHLMYPDSLHHIVWLALQYYIPKQKAQPDYRFQIFSGLQLSISNVNTASPESLCQLDIDVFLYATVYVTAVALEERRAMCQDAPTYFPVSISQPLCTTAQADWWASAYMLYNNLAKEHLGDLRRTLQRGIEVVRLLGNHGMDVNLVVQLAETFAERAQELKAQNESDQWRLLESRAALYWKAGIAMLERLMNNQTCRTPKERLFESRARDPSTEEVKRLLDEGRFFLACQAMNASEHEEAIEAFENLKTPYASYYQALIYRKLAAEECNQPRELITSEMRSKHIILLTRARDALYVTLDRLQGNRKHPLNQVLSDEIEDIETKLARIDPDTAQRHEFDGLSDECLSSQDSEEAESSLPHHLPSTQNLSRKSSSAVVAASTMQHSPQVSLTPFATPPAAALHGGRGVLDSPDHQMTRHREEHMRPSPERLDAQVRYLTYSHETVLKTFLEQNKTVLETSKSIVDELRENKLIMGQIKNYLEDIQKQIAISQTTRSRKSRRTPTPMVPQMGATNGASGFGQPKFGIDPVMDEKDAVNVATDEDDYEGYYYDEEDEAEYDSCEDPTAVIGMPPYPDYQYGAGYKYPEPPLHNEYPYGHVTGLHGTSTVTYAPPPSGRGLPVQPPAGYPPPGFYAGAPPPPPPPTAMHPISGMVERHHQVGAGYFSSPGTAIAAGLPFSEGQKLPEFNFNPSLPPPQTQIVMSPAVPPAKPLTSSVFSRLGPVPPMEGSTQQQQQPQIPPKLPATPSANPPAVSTVTSLPSSFTPSLPPSTTSAPGTSGGFSFHIPDLSAVAGKAASSPSTSTATPPPHAFQIPLPSHMTLSSPTTSKWKQGTIEGGNAETTPTKLTPKSPLVVKGSPGFRRSTSTCSGGGDEEELSVGTDFKPLIPLPDEIEVKTGEEDEKLVFEERAKLFRFVNKEWKERGVGVLKILYNETTRRFRILMRRDQVWKICANHFILPDLKLSPMKNLEVAWVWAANDYADEQVQTEQFCVRFKNKEIAQLFKVEFEAAQEISRARLNAGNNTIGVDKIPGTNTTTSDVAAEETQGFGDKFKLKPGVWTCSACLVNNGADLSTCAACQTTKSGAVTKETTKVASSPQSNKFAFVGVPRAPVEAEGFGDKFKVKIGTWNCEVCLVNNAADRTSCAACETPRPGCAPAAISATPSVPSSTKSKFLFTGSSTTSGFNLPTNTATPTTMTVTFGFPALVTTVSQTTVMTSASVPTNSFTFCPTVESLASSTSAASAVSTSVSLPTLTFGGTTSKQQKDQTGFVFGSPSATVQPKPGVGGGFVFGASSVPNVEKEQFAENSPASTSATPFSYGGFTFTTSPTIKTTVEEIVTPTTPTKLSPTRPVMATKSKEKIGTKDKVVLEEQPGVSVSPSKPSPFAGFSFTPTKPESREYRGSLFNILTGGSKDGIPESEPASKGTELLFSSLTSTKDDAFQKDPNFKGFDGVGRSVFGAKSKERVTTEDDNTSGDADTYEPQVDFAPVIPMPELIDVRTGEEDDVKLFGERARLYRFDSTSGQWKERGIGEMKISRQTSGVYRLLMRREQVHKLCVNHTIAGSMELMPMADRAWTWAAQDFSEGELRPELFAIRFKTQEIANRFRDVFTSCVEETKKMVACSAEVVPVEVEGAKSGGGLLPTPPSKSGEVDAGDKGDCNRVNAGGDSSDKLTEEGAEAAPLVPLSEMFKPKENSWECSLCYLRNDGDQDRCAACETPKQMAQLCPDPPAASGMQSQFKFPFASKSSAPEGVSGFAFGSPSGGFNFTSTPGTVTTPAFGTAASGFESFRFGQPSFAFGAKEPSQETPPPMGEAEEEELLTTTPSKPSAPPAVEFKFGSPQSFTFSFSGVRPRSPSKSVKSPAADKSIESVSGEVLEDSVGGGDEEADQIYFQPVIPLPDKVEVRTGEEDEEVLYCHRAKLFRLVGSEWKERGLGDIKILRQIEAPRRVRLLMRREQIHKVCLNHVLTTKLKFVAKDEKSWMWATTDFAENEATQEVFTLRLKNAEIAKQFMAALESARQDMDSGTTKVEGAMKKLGIDVAALVPPVLPPQDATVSSTSPVKVSPDEELASKKNTLSSPGKGSSFSFRMEGVAPSSSNLSPVTPFSFGNKFGTVGTGANTSLFGGTAFGTLAKSQETTSEIQIKSSSPLVPVTEVTTPGVTNQKTVDHTTADKSLDICYVKEATPEQVAKARHLLLPPNFYLFEDKPPCPGCRGCEDEEGQARYRFRLLENVPSPTTTAQQQRSRRQQQLQPQQPDFEIVQETKADPAKVEQALQLGLPPNFYLYEKREPCPGCRGCDESEPPVLKLKESSVLPVEEKETVIIAEQNVATSVIGTTNEKEKQSPSVKEKQSPSVKEKQSPSVKEKQSPSVKEKQSPAVKEKQSPAVKEKQSPAVKEKQSPAVKEKQSPAVKEKQSPAVKEKQSPAVKEKQSPAEKEKQSPAEKEKQSQTEKDSGTHDGLMFQSSSLDFASLAQKEPTFFKSVPLSTGFAYEGAGSKVFSRPRVKTDDSTNSQDDQDGEPHANADIHFEPLIPLPSLIDVKTGEEDEDKIYNQRAKLYRYDKTCKEWKERGVGEAKILKHKQTGRYRLILRREQVHKIACNHYITRDICLNPLATSEQAWCWFAMDFAEEKGRLEQFAIRFKTTELAREFYRVFKRCQEEDVMNKSAEVFTEQIGDTSATTDTSSSSLSINDSQQSTDGDETQQQQESYSEGGVSTDQQVPVDDVSGEVRESSGSGVAETSKSAVEETEEDEEEDEDSVMFEKRVSLGFMDLKGNFSAAALGNLRVVYDDDFYGARVQVVTDTGELVCNHLIAMQTTLRVEGKKCFWGAEDFSGDHPTYKQFQATFGSPAAAKEFEANFNEGKDYAKHSDISERPFNPAGGDGISDNATNLHRAASVSQSPSESEVRACCPLLAATLSEIIRGSQ